MSAEFDSYIRKRESWVQADSAADQLIGEIKAIAEPLISNWRKCYIQAMGLPNPTGLISGRTKVDVKQWPSMQKLHDAIVAAFTADEEMRRAWAAVPAEERKHLKEPSSLGTRVTPRVRVDRSTPRR